MSRVVIGTSGWHYDSWRSRFFPQKLLIRHQLAFYATQFDSTELNGVFYRTPSVETVEAWRTQTPDCFVFAWKASKFITHWKRLSVSSVNSIELMESRLRLLGSKAGPVLFQLPPQFRCDYDRLASFLTLIERKRTYAFEFRHNSWYDDRILDLLREHGIALCLSDHADAPAPWEVTARHVYLRGHGPGGSYQGNYPMKTLNRWACQIHKWKRQRRDVYVYFDNDQKAAAPADAMKLKQLCADQKERS
jgi:uncharacterized protein YecE (DUF72 family)